MASMVQDALKSDDEVRVQTIHLYPCRCFACTLHECMVTRNLYRGWVLGRNPDKSLAIHSHLYSFALRFLFLQTHATSYSFFSSLLYTVQEKGGKPDRKPYPLPNSLRYPYGNLSRTLEIMPRNLKEIVRSWIRLQDVRGDGGRCCAICETLKNCTKPGLREEKNLVSVLVKSV